ncbi:hypothetical protein H8N03_05800 [Ramlibacter sp. USB13]|uniref:Sel1 repeat family protein n=1 Tax=Ramlibacter cellulosilyticus TaxID=2764187 RepID=A0A923MPG6_9BURK|nr:hypothetical protein [Ramlibacter cellulosilyticus]MBC5782448.1 hypothetical protein [Ramlibacter cellulosilyticus]
MGPLQRRIATAVAAALLLASSLPALAASPAEREYADAVRSFRAGRLPEAFGQFMALANRGDVDSARIALFMHSYGPVLYGKQWDAGPQNVAYWDLLVRNSGTSARPMPEFQPAVLTPSRAKPRPLPVRARPAGSIAEVAGN